MRMRIWQRAVLWASLAVGALGGIAGIYAVPKVRTVMADSALQQGEALAARGRWEDAQTQFVRALRWNPGSAAAHYGLGTVRFGQGDSAGARAAWEQALAMDPANLKALFELGNLWRNTGDCQQAAAVYRRALTLSPRQTAIRVNLALCYEALGDLAAAHREMEEVVVAAPQFRPLLDRIRALSPEGRSGNQ